VKKNIFYFIIFGLLNSCINPFAPARIDSDLDISLGDQTTVQGFFQCFAYAYNMRDTVVYGSLLGDDFIFSYRNYDKGMDFS